MISSPGRGSSLVILGLAAGQAARSIREADGGGSLLLAGEERHLPYDRPPLTKEFLRGEKPREQLFFEDEPSYRERGIELALGSPVRELDGAAKTVRFAGGEVVQFEKSLIATGGH